MSDTLEADVNPRLFRRVMGRFTTGVTVITVGDGHDVRGMTANAFMSGSLEPPLCLVSVAKRARMHAHMMKAEHFGVNVLAENQIDISEHFAGRPNPVLTVEFEHLGPVPLLADACARIATRIAAKHECGDHTLFIGHIVRMLADDRAPLVYHAGRYRGLTSSRLDHNATGPEFW